MQSIQIHESRRLLEICDRASSGTAILGRTILWLAGEFENIASIPCGNGMMGLSMRCCIVVVDCELSGIQPRVFYGELPVIYAWNWMRRSIEGMIRVPSPNGFGSVCRLRVISGHLPSRQRVGLTVVNAADDNRQRRRRGS
jgi:hypothetical protein